MTSAETKTKKNNLKNHSITRFLKSNDTTRHDAAQWNYSLKKKNHVKTMNGNILSQFFYFHGMHMRNDININKKKFNLTLEFTQMHCKWENGKS